MPSSRTEVPAFSCGHGLVFDNRSHTDIHVDGAEANESKGGGANLEATDRGNDEVVIPTIEIDTDPD
jgi:hypothetical protein